MRTIHEVRDALRLLIPKVSVTRDSESGRRRVCGDVVGGADSACACEPSRGSSLSRDGALAFVFGLARSRSVELDKRGGLRK